MILKIKNKEINYMLHHHLYINMVYLLNRSIINYIYRFKKGDFVIEYTGEIIRNALADFREVTYNE